MSARPPSGTAWVWLTRDLLESSSWRLLSINGRRLIDFLLIEHMRHGGKQNGDLLAPRRQLVEFGIGEHFISSAIDEVERLGLVDCNRGIGRRASTYALTWLPLRNGATPSNRWREKSAVEHSKEMSAVSSENECQTALTKPVASAKQHSQTPKSSSAKQHSPSRYSYQGGDVSQKVGDRVVSLRKAAGSGKRPSAGKPNGQVSPW